jgi:transposase
VFDPVVSWSDRERHPRAPVRVRDCRGEGIHNLDRLLEAARDVPMAARPALELLAGQLRDLEERIEETTARITTAQKADPLARRLATIPGLGPIACSAVAATTPDVAAFRSARDDAAGVTLGLTPRAHSSGGKERLGRIGKAGNRDLRRLLSLGASCAKHAFDAMARISARRGRRATPDRHHTRRAHTRPTPHPTDPHPTGWTGCSRASR